VTGEEALAPNASQTVIKAFQKRQRQCRATIILNVKDAQIPHCSGETPTAVWDNLAKIHQSKGWASRLSLLRQFISVRKAEDMSMQAHIAQVIRLATRLNSIGVKTTEEDKILVLLNGLPEDYLNLVMTLEGMAETSPNPIAEDAASDTGSTAPHSVLSFDYVTNRLLNEEARRTSCPDQWSSKPSARG
jgi:hypothetical protein